MTANFEPQPLLEPFPTDIEAYFKAGLLPDPKKLFGQIIKVDGVKDGEILLDEEDRDGAGQIQGREKNIALVNKQDKLVGYAEQKTYYHPELDEYYIRYKDVNEIPLMNSAVEFDRKRNLIYERIVDAYNSSIRETVINLNTGEMMVDYDCHDVNGVRVPAKRLIALIRPQGSSLQAIQARVIHDPPDLVRYLYNNLKSVIDAEAKRKIGEQLHPQIVEDLSSPPLNLQVDFTQWDTSNGSCISGFRREVDGDDNATVVQNVGLFDEQEKKYRFRRAIKSVTQGQTIETFDFDQDFSEILRYAIETPMGIFVFKFDPPGDIYSYEYHLSGREFCGGTIEQLQQQCDIFQRWPQAIEAARRLFGEGVFQQMADHGVDLPATLQKMLGNLSSRSSLVAKPAAEAES